MEENCILLPYLGKKPQQQKIQIHIVDIYFVECITSRVKLNILFIYLFFFFTFEMDLPNFARKTTMYMYAEQLIMVYFYIIMFCLFLISFYNLLILFFKVSKYEHPSFRELIWDLIFSKNISNEFEKVR